MLSGVKAFSPPCTIRAGDQLYCNGEKKDIAGEGTFKSVAHYEGGWCVVNRFDRVVCPEGTAPPKEMGRVKSLHKGSHFVCALDAKGFLWCWGASEARKYAGDAQHTVYAEGFTHNVPAPAFGSPAATKAMHAEYVIPYRPLLSIEWGTSRICVIVHRRDGTGLATAGAQAHKVKKPPHVRLWCLAVEVRAHPRGGHLLRAHLYHVMHYQHLPRAPLTPLPS